VPLLDLAAAPEPESYVSVWLGLILIGWRLRRVRSSVAR